MRYLAGDQVAAYSFVRFEMRQGIHPKYNTVTATCSCGESFAVGTTSGHDFSLDVCSNCHPFYTGKQKQATTGGRVERFNKRFGAAMKRG
jgi:large subunit ribosomal protein L31